MTADELRAEVWAMLRDELGADAQIQGKRIIVDIPGGPFIILVTAVKAT